MNYNLNEIIFPLFGVLVEETVIDVSHTCGEKWKVIANRGVVMNYLSTKLFNDKKEMTISEETLDMILKEVPDYSSTFYKNWKERNENVDAGNYTYHVLYHYLNTYGSENQKFLYDLISKSSKIGSSISVIGDEECVYNVLKDGFKHVVVDKDILEQVEKIGEGSCGEFLSNIRYIPIISIDDLSLLMDKVFDSSQIPSVTDLAYIKDILLHSKNGNEPDLYYKDDRKHFVEKWSSRLFDCDKGKLIKPYTCRDINYLIKSIYCDKYLCESADEFFKIISMSIGEIFIRNRNFRKRLRKYIYSVLADPNGVDKICFDFILNNIRNNHIVLSHGFNRHTHLFLSIKHVFKTDEQYQDVVTNVNKISKLSKTHHIPITEISKTIDTALVMGNTDAIFNESISTIFKLRKAFLSKSKDSKLDSSFHTITLRNGLTFKKILDENLKSSVLNEPLFNNMLTEKIQRMLKIKGYKYYKLDKHMNYSIPLRRKGLIDNIPCGTIVRYIKLGNNDSSYAFGVNWNINVDYDLAVSKCDVTYKSDKSSIYDLKYKTLNFRSISGNSSSSSLIHSGDITSVNNCNKQATELIMLNKCGQLVNSKLIFQIYKYSDHCQTIDDKSYVKLVMIETNFHNIDNFQGTCDLKQKDEVLFDLKIPRSVFKNSRSLNLGYVNVYKMPNFEDYIIDFIIDPHGKDNNNVGYDSKAYDSETVELLSDKTTGWNSDKIDFHNTKHILKEIDYSLNSLQLNELLRQTDLQEIYDDTKDKPNESEVFDLSYDKVKNDPLFWDIFFM